MSSGKFIKNCDEGDVRLERKAKKIENQFGLIF